VARQLEEKLDKELPPAALRIVRKHLAHCPNCTAYLDSLKKTVLLYRCYPDPNVSARLRQELIAVLALSH